MQPFQAAATSAVSKMIVDGQRWMTAGPNFDYTTCGRLLSYFANSTGVGGLNHGHYHYFAAFVPWSQAFPRFQSATLTPAPLTPLAVLWGGLLHTPWATSRLPNASLVAGFAAQLDNGGIVGATGHRHYWRSDYSVLRRPASAAGRLGYMVSVRMASTRTVSGECGNEENKQGQDLSDGVTNVYVSGREFEDIYPVWDWRRLPGTIEAQAPMPPPGTGTNSCQAFIQDLHAKHRTQFVGGTSDGSVGITVMDFRSRGELSVRRTWFMFDGVVIVSNTGGTTALVEHPVATSLDQRLANGNATYALRTAAAPFATPPLELGVGPNVTLTTTLLAWLHHSNIGYVPLPTPRMAAAGRGALPRYTVRASLQNQTGSWENITQTRDAHPVTKPLFTAIIDHGSMGTTPLDVSSTYAIVPGVASAAAMQAALDDLDARFSVQAGWNASSACAVGATEATVTMMAALWQHNARATAAAAGCWDITLVSVARADVTVGTKSTTMAAAHRSHDRNTQTCAGATAPIKDMHCDLQHSTALAAVPSGNATSCAASCCRNLQCSCWTWTPDEQHTGPHTTHNSTSFPFFKRVPKLLI